MPTKWILLSQNWLAIKQPQHQENNSNKEILHKLYPLSSYCSYTFLSNTATTTATTTRLHKEEKQQQQLHIQTSCFDFFYYINYSIGPIWFFCLYFFFPSSLLCCSSLVLILIFPFPCPFYFLLRPLPQHLCPPPNSPAFYVLL